MRYTRKVKKWLDEINEIMRDFPPEISLAKFVVDNPDQGKRLVWLLVATGHEIAPRVIHHFGWEHAQQIRDEAYGTKYWDDPVYRESLLLSEQ